MPVRPIGPGKEKLCRVELIATGRPDNKGMSRQELQEQLTEFQSWKQRQSRLLRQLAPWLKQQGLYTAEVRRAIERASQALQDDSVVLAVTGEYSRGKTELINALFFANYGRRILPADAGRTTMCPTELFCEPDSTPQLRLLPIETRRDDVSLAALRSDESAWQCFDLDPADPDAVAARLGMLTEHMEVPRSAAVALGFPAATGDAADAATGQPEDDPVVSVPRWRLAQVNLPHPLLERGLRILDTPGLNAIGNEPELTYEMLPAAHAVIFVLAADTGVTRSDLHVWQRYVYRPGEAERRGVMVVLNKTDTLWDDLRSSSQITESIIRQCREVVETLDVHDSQVFAVSAHKALLARIKHDNLLEQRSGIAGLESFLSDTLMANRRDLVRREHTYLVQQALHALEAIIRGRLDRNENQRLSLAELSGQSDQAINSSLEVIQEDYERYQGDVDDYKQSVAAFSEHAKQLGVALNAHMLDRTLQEIHDMMTGAWTTYGLREAMRKLFEDVNARIDTASEQTQSMRRLLRTVYRRFENEHGFQLTQPAMFSIVRHQVELSLLEQEAEIFRNSARTTLMEQHFVTKRYFRTIVARTQRIINQAYREAKHWSEGAFAPLAAEIKAHRDDLAQQMADLREVGESRKTIQQRIAALQRDNARLRAQLAALAKVSALLTDPEPAPQARASGQN